MDPKELQSFERQPAFRVYPAGEDPLPSDIQKIRDKWVRLGVDIGTVWRIIRMGCNILEDAYVISDPDTPDELTPRFIAREDYARKFLDSLSPHMRKLVKRIRNDNRKPEEKEKDRERLMAHCGEWSVTSFEWFCEQIMRKDPLLDRVPLPDPIKRQRGKPGEFVHYLGYLISGLVRKAGLQSKRGPKKDRFYGIEIVALLAYYYQLDVITVDHLKDAETYYKKIPLERHPRWCPKALIKTCLS